VDFYDVIKTRRSIRSYKNDPIPDLVLNKVLKAIRIAPSGSNLQPWHWILVRNKDIKYLLARACNDQMWINEAPLVIVACGKDLQYNRGGYMGEMSMLVDLSIAFTHLILAARNEGLGTCWIGAFNNVAIKKLLKIPESWNVVAVTPLGYPDEEEKAFMEPGSRKSIEEIFTDNNF
jgi:nitroreductase